MVQSSEIMRSPLQSIRNEAHNVWIALNKRHAIVVSWCSCIEAWPKPVTMLLQCCTKLNMQHIWDTVIMFVPQFLVDGTPKTNVQPCRLSNLNLRKDNRSTISGITTYLQII